MRLNIGTRLLDLVASNVPDAQEAGQLATAALSLGFDVEAGSRVSGTSEVRLVLDRSTDTHVAVPDLVARLMALLEMTTNKGLDEISKTATERAQTIINTR